MVGETQFKSVNPQLWCLNEFLAYAYLFVLLVNDLGAHKAVSIYSIVSSIV